MKFCTIVWKDQSKPSITLQFHKLQHYAGWLKLTYSPSENSERIDCVNLDEVKTYTITNQEPDWRTK